MKTSEQWWAETKADAAKLASWLQRQAHGERTAAERIRRHVVGAAGRISRARMTFERIAREEELHAEWIEALLHARGIPLLQKHEERYWKETLPLAEGSFDRAAAIAAHAEAMRLERIRVIALDADAPRDIREVFARILPMEERHEALFRQACSPEALDATRDAHLRGTDAIGLIQAAEVL